jgi:hypothetical protein
MNNFKDKYLKYKKKYLDLQSKSQKGGGYILENEDIRQFTNIDLRNTLNEESMSSILNNTMPQTDINKHLLTAIVTVYNLVNKK